MSTSWHAGGKAKAMLESYRFNGPCNRPGRYRNLFRRQNEVLGCRTIGVKRRVGDKPEAVDELYGMEELDNLLPRADVVAMSLPGNPSTYHVLNRERIALLSSNAIVLNAGRGTAIDTDALSDALYEGKIAGAALDVTDPEPLPAELLSGKRPEHYNTPYFRRLCAAGNPSADCGDLRR